MPRDQRRPILQTGPPQADNPHAISYTTCNKPRTTTLTDPLTYHPEVFAVGNLAQARAIILTDEDGIDSETRWTHETPYLAELIAEHLAPRPDQLIIDYGCGIGRLSREMIARHGCFVLGVDISAEMRALAATYVNSERFAVCAPELLDDMIARGLRADGAVAVWVLQHCFDPIQDIERLRASLVHGARLFVVNNKSRAVPTREQAWVHDGIDIRELLQTCFKAAREATLTPSRVSSRVAGFSFHGTYTR